MSTYGYAPVLPVMGTCLSHVGQHEHSEECSLWARGMWKAAS